MHDGIEPRQDNLYAPPTAPIVDPQTEAASRPTPFYVVSTAKVAVLSIVTFGLYTLYWFWRHWKLHKIDRKLDIWPVPRAVFSIFFAHSLNSEIDHRITRNGERHRWSPGLWATLYVVAVIASRIANRVPETVMSAEMALLASMTAVFAITASLFHAQRAANIASGDPQALSNNRFTVANWVWIVLGGLFWLLLGIGLMLPEEAV
ncbi:MAG: DUF4234 domain-containing protein [Lysobacter sp.]|nr:DUF4234 domain-containing protein [Lysobacter sp.]